MVKTLIYMLLSMTILVSQEIVVIASKSFKDADLSINQIRSIFLAKKQFYQGKRILVMNYESNHPLRKCFEKTILDKKRSVLEEYWRHAHYKGKHPPKVIESQQMLLSYLTGVEHAMGYVDNTSVLAKNITVIYRRECL